MRRLLLVALAVGLAQTATGPAAAAADPVIAAAGDIACDPADSGYNGGAGTSTRCRQRATSDLLVGGNLAAVLPLGDIQYNSASLSNIMAVYDPTWGRVKPISRPILGNHESGGTGYFDYFNGAGASNGPAGERGKGYYSFDVGSWHLVALNSNCDRVACAAGSEQEQWLRADLAAHPASCTLAYWHHPRFSSGHDGSNTFMQPLWQALYEADAEIVLSGHSHDYERFAPLDANGNLDGARGMRQFVVGTGGAFFTGIGSRIANSEVAQNDSFGVLKLTLHPASYEWQFAAATGLFGDSGSGVCHGLRSAPSGFNTITDRTRPVLSRLSLSRKRITLNGRKRWTRFRFRLSERAAVTYAISRRSRGRYRRVVSLTRPGSRGSNRKRFSRRIGKRKLRLGTYRARLVATDAAGNRSRPKQVGFRVVRR